MNTYERMNVYARSGRPWTARQRRRLVKKAGTDPSATVGRDDGMGYPPAMQGYRDILGARPASRDETPAEPEAYDGVSL